MHHLAIALRSFAVIAMLGTFGCATDDDGTSIAPDPITGTWDGGFTSDNQTVPSGTFSFMITEDASHNISGAFTGTAIGQNLTGTVSGKRTGDKLTGTINVTAPIAVMFALPTATIDGNTISGNFEIMSPFVAKGNFNVTKK